MYNIIKHVLAVHSSRAHIYHLDRKSVQNSLSGCRNRQVAGPWWVWYTPGNLLSSTWNWERSSCTVSLKKMKHEYSIDWLMLHFNPDGTCCPNAWFVPERLHFRKKWTAFRSWRFIVIHFLIQPIRQRVKTHWVPFCSLQNSWYIWI